MFEGYRECGFLDVKGFKEVVLVREENKEWILNNTNNGIITSKAVTEHGIHRSVLGEMGKIQRECLVIYKRSW